MEEIREISSGTNTEVNQPQPPNASDVADMFSKMNRIEENAVVGKGHHHNDVEIIAQQVNVVHDNPVQQSVNVAELASNLYWEKRMEKMSWGFLNPKRELCVDQTELNLVDLETTRFWDYDILKANMPNMENKPNMEKYFASGWYEYATSKKIKVGDVLQFHY
ncbi:hypothetical protein KIW84_060553 [Lathyrus oleraceus]|uniref:TF-B3 domain-containing protein n=1 Tax=Pisum sativum TaxID=3888 RepID=A0A9D4W326_PEA|nr:hypothetical protein KIW84_060553 [Pisum sativum]